MRWRQTFESILISEKQIEFYIPLTEKANYKIAVLHYCTYTIEFTQKIPLFEGKQKQQFNIQLPKKYLPAIILPSYTLHLS